MIRTLWTVLATIALANLFAIGGFVGWLVTTDRLDGDRFEQIRTLFSETITEVTAREEAEQVEADAIALAAQEEEDSKLPPLSAEDRLLRQTEFDTILQQQVERTRRTIADMRRALDEEQTSFKNERDEFETERAVYEKMRAKIAAVEGDVQFKKALKLYESLRPNNAAQTLTQIYQQGERDQVVSYLNEMESRKASKILAQFEPAMAADLLERLRTRGLVAAVPEEP